MRSNIKALLAAAGVAAFAFSPANAFEGGVQWQTKPGIFIGASAGVPPPGIYMFNQVFTYQTNLAGPLTTLVGNKQGVQAAVDVQGFLFVPGWTFLGGTYDFVVAQPFGMVSIGQPLSLGFNQIDMFSGVHNTYAANELAWKFGSFAIKTGLGMYIPDGTIQGATAQTAFGVCPNFAVGCNGFANFGNKYWTFQPELILSYLGQGWNLSGAFYAEINTANQPDDYTQGTVFHADFTATYTLGKWTFGPVGYYVAQVSDDKCSSVTCLLIHPQGILGNTQRFQLAAVGGLVEYNFGPASLSFWATQEVYAKASGALPAPLFDDLSFTTRGSTLFGTLSYRIWAPEEPAKAAPMIHK
jgi:hypothetical protein